LQNKILTQNFSKNLIFKTEDNVVAVSYEKLSILKVTEERSRILSGMGIPILYLEVRIRTKMSRIPNTRNNNVPGVGCGALDLGELLERGVDHVGDPPLTRRLQVGANLVRGRVHHSLTLQYERRIS
jgi:hypothetical protein